MTPLAAAEVLCGTTKEPSPTLIVAELLGNLEPEEEVAESYKGVRRRRKARVM